MYDHSSGSLVLITGGARSGKSTYAEKLALESGKEVIYLATARVEDEEMKERVAAHKARRPANFKTVEEPEKPHLVLYREAAPGRLILLDCLTLLMSNLILANLERHDVEGRGEDIYADEVLLEEAGREALEYVASLAQAAANCPAEVIVVTNEVGLGVVPDYPLGRTFRDYSGRANQVMAEAANQVWLVICGIPQRFK